MTYRRLPNNVKISLALAVLASGGTAALAQEQGRVISSTPLIAQVGVPRQVCSQSQVQVQAPKSGAGALMGAIAGGAIGSNLGGGDGRLIASAIGLMGGAILGDRLEGASPAQTQTVQNCTNQTFYENRTTGYNVVYEFNGKQYTVQMPQDPGPFVILQVTPVGVPAAPIAQPTPAMQVLPDGSQPMLIQGGQPQAVVTQIMVPPVIVAAAPTVVYAYPGYYARPYYPPVGLNFNLGWGGQRRHWR